MPSQVLSVFPPGLNLELIQKIIPANFYVLSDSYILNR